MRFVTIESKNITDSDMKQLSKLNMIDKIITSPRYAEIELKSNITWERLNILLDFLKDVDIDVQGYGTKACELS